MYPKLLVEDITSGYALGPRACIRHYIVNSHLTITPITNAAQRLLCNLAYLICTHHSSHFVLAASLLPTNHPCRSMSFCPCHPIYTTLLAWIVVALKSSFPPKVPFEPLLVCLRVLIYATSLSVKFPAIWHVHRWILHISLSSSLMGK